MAHCCCCYGPVKNARRIRKKIKNKFSAGLIIIVYYGDCLRSVPYNKCAHVYLLLRNVYVYERANAAGFQKKKNEFNWFLFSSKIAYASSPFYPVRRTCLIRAIFRRDRLPARGGSSCSVHAARPDGNRIRRIVTRNHILRDRIMIRTRTRTRLYGHRARRRETRSGLGRRWLYKWATASFRRFRSLNIFD